MHADPHDEKVKDEAELLAAMSKAVEPESSETDAAEARAAELALWDATSGDGLECI